MSSEVDEPRACNIQSEANQKEKKQILCINTYVWNLGRWYPWTYLQGRNRDTDIENRLVDTAGEGEGGMNWESSIEIYALPCVKTDSQWEAAI